MNMKNRHAFLYFLICSITFTTLLSSSLDSHFDRMVNERITFGGWSAFTAARALSPTIVRAVTELGVPERPAAMLYIGVSVFTLLYAYAGLLVKMGVGGGYKRTLQPDSFPSHPSSHGLELHHSQFSSLH